MERSSWYLLAVVLLFFSALVFYQLAPVLFPGLFYARPSLRQLRIADAVRDQVLAVVVILGLYVLLGFTLTKMYLRRRIWTSWQFRLYAAGVMGIVCLFGVLVGMAHPVVDASRSIRIDSTYIERGFPLPWWVKSVPHYGWPGFIDVPQYSIRGYNLIFDIVFWLATGAVLVLIGVMLRLRLHTKKEMLFKTRCLGLITLSIILATIILMIFDWYDIPPFPDPKRDGLIEPEIGGHMDLEGGTENGDTWILTPESEALVTLTFGPKKGIAKGVSLLLETNISLLKAEPNWTNIREGRYQWRFTTLPNKEAGNIQMKVAVNKGKGVKHPLIIYYAYTNEDPVVIANKTIIVEP